MPTTFALSVETWAVPPRDTATRTRAGSPDSDVRGGLYPKGSAVSLPAMSVTSSGESGEAYAGLTGRNGEPFNYPTPLYVRNTFVDLHPPRDPSLDEFFEERRTHSCPASWGHGKDYEEVPPGEETTACGSEGSSHSTPPQLSDTEDICDVTPLDTPRATSHAVVMPTSRVCFRNTLSDYRNGVADLSGDAVPFSPVSYGYMGSPGYPSSCFPAPGTFSSVPAPPSHEADCNNGFGSPYAGGGSTYAGGYNGGFQHGSYAAASFPEIAPPRNLPEMPGMPGGHQGHMVTLQLSNALQQQQLQQQQQQQQQQHLSAPPMPPPGAPVVNVKRFSAKEPIPPQGAPRFQEELLSEEQMIEFPTRGSLQHGNGRCKPCAFVHTKGCGNGFECPFCHLCDPGEKKKRRKDKLEARKAIREIRQALSLGPQGLHNRGKNSWNDCAPYAP